MENVRKFERTFKYGIIFCGALYALGFTGTILNIDLFANRFFPATLNALGLISIVSMLIFYMKTFVPATVSIAEMETAMEVFKDKNSRLQQENAQTIANLESELKKSQERFHLSESSMIQINKRLKENIDLQHDHFDQLNDKMTSISQVMANIDSVLGVMSQNMSKTIEGSQLASGYLANMLEAVREIESSNNEIVNKIQESNKDFENIVAIIMEIHEKTMVINDIVFQTKLLSFNASVEAARAGEHGKGFAVVAEEVGNLARMSGNASREISAMLDKSCQQVHSIIENMKSKTDHLLAFSKEKIDKGSKIALDCESIMQKIFEETNASSLSLLQINMSSSQQVQDIKEVKGILQTIGNVSQKNIILISGEVKTTDCKENLVPVIKNAPEIPMVNGTKKAIPSAVIHKEKVNTSQVDKKEWGGVKQTRSIEKKAVVKEILSSSKAEVKADLATVTSLPESTSSQPKSSIKKSSSHASKKVQNAAVPSASGDEVKKHSSTPAKVSDDMHVAGFDGAPSPDDERFID